MKKTMALLIGACGVLPVYAQSTVTVYGLLDLSAGRSNTGSGVTLPGGTVPSAPAQKIDRLDSGVAYGSRLGVQAAADLGGGLRAKALAEMGVSADTGGSNQGGLAFGRQVYVGFTAPSWSVTAGRQYTPMNYALATSEALNGGYWGNITAEAVSAYESIGSSAGDGTPVGGRADNSVLGSYTSGAFTGKLMATAGNENSRGTGRLIDASILYNDGPLMLTAVAGRVRQPASMIIASASPEWMNSWMLGGSYDLAVAKIFLGAYQFTGPKNFANLSPAATLGSSTAASQAYTWEKNRIVWFGATVPVGNGQVLAQVARETFPYAGAPEGAGTIVGLSYDYFLTKQAVLYTSYGQVTNNSRARVPLYGSIPLVGPNGFGSDPRALSFGMRYSF